MRSLSDGPDPGECKATPAHGGVRQREWGIGKWVLLARAIGGVGEASGCVVSRCTYAGGMPSPYSRNPVFVLGEIMYTLCFPCVAHPICCPASPPLPALTLVTQRPLHRRALQ